MKILHTSDWHFGKRLFGRERLEAQRAFGEELVRIVREKGVRLVLVAGDVFDTATPSGEAENLFYDVAAALGKHAVVVIISGNHDDPARLSAAKQLARVNHIVMVGDYGAPLGDEHVAASGDGWLRLNIDGETVNLVVLPYPSDARTGELVEEGVTYADRVSLRLHECAKEAFSEEGTRIVMTHLFCAGGKKSGSERDIELGTARIVPLDALPECDYTALGHIHRPMRMGKNIFYSGSPMPFTFDDDTGKIVNIFDTETHAATAVRLSAYDRLVTVETSNLEEALNALQADSEALTQVILHVEKPLLSQETRALRAHSNLVKLVLDVAKEKRSTMTARDTKTPEQIFTEYCGHCNVEPKRELIDLFLSLVGEV